MPPQVSPVFRPLLATVKLRERASPRPPVEEMRGGTAARVPSARLPPNSRILPAGSTAREVTCAIAASALVSFELSASQPDREATGVTPAPSPSGVQLLSISPG